MAGMERARQVAAVAGDLRAVVLSTWTGPASSTTGHCSNNPSTHLSSEMEKLPMMEPCALTTATALQVHSGLRAGLRTRRKGRLRAGLEAGLRMRRKARGRACAPGTRGRACAPQSQASHAALNAAAGGGDSISRHLRRQPCARPWCPLGPTHGAMLHPTNPCQCRPMQHLMFFSSMSTMASSAGVSGRTCGGAERNMERSPISWLGGRLAQRGRVAWSGARSVGWASALLSGAERNIEWSPISWPGSAAAANCAPWGCVRWMRPCWLAEKTDA